MKNSIIFIIMALLWFSACSADESEHVSLTVDEAQIIYNSYPSCEESSSSCTGDSKCYFSHFGYVCLPNEEAACQLFGCADSCTVKTQHFSDVPTDPWILREVTSCLPKMPDEKNSPCETQPDNSAENCKMPNVVMSEFGCNLCVPQKDACEMMGCPTDDCSLGMVTWDGVDSSGTFFIFDNCLKTD